LDSASKILKRPELESDILPQTLQPWWKLKPNLELLEAAKAQIAPYRN